MNEACFKSEELEYFFELDLRNLLREKQIEELLIQ